MIVLISGLSQSGKSSFAEAVANAGLGYTHVPLDKYILEVPEGFTFLEWVDSPNCIDWELLQVHLETLKRGEECHTPQFDFDNRCRRVEGPGRLLKPAERGYLVPGCHAIRMPLTDGPSFKIFVHTPLNAVASRHLDMEVDEVSAPRILDERHSPGWRKILSYQNEADLVISGTDPQEKQISDFQVALASS